MASFADAIPQFNPYIQQLPVEAMVAVGMEKQQRYDQGIQKIQSQIDQVAGLSISRPQDRQYLQSQLNNLGSKLKTVAAGDFSNYQLVNSVAGMAGSIIKDPTVIASVQSTAQRKALQDKKQKDIDSGNYNPANEFLLNLTEEQWFNNPEVGANYTGYYRTPIDVWSKIKDIAGEVGIDEKTLQNLFETDELGRKKLDRDGNPIWNNIMVEETLKGKDASKILNAFQNALTPADYEQLSTEGRYKYRDFDEEVLAQSVLSSTDKNIKFNNGKIELLKINLAEEQSKAKTTEYDEKLIQSISDEIKYFENLNIGFDKSRKNILESVARNPEAAKAALYTDNYLSNMSEVFSSKEISRKFSVNPMFEVSMKLNEFEQRQREFNLNYDLRKKADKRDQEKHDLEIEALQERAAYFQSGGVDEPINADSTMVRSMVEDSYANSVLEYNSINNKLALETLRMANPGDSQEELMKKLYDVAAYNGQTINPGSAEINKTAQIMASSLINTYRTNPDKVPKTLHGLINQADDVLKNVETQKSIIAKAQEDAKSEAILRGIDLESYDKAINAIKPTSLKLKSGESVNLSKQDIIDFVNIRPDLQNVFGEFTVDGNQEMLKNQAQARLNAKFGYEKMKDLTQILYPRVPSQYGGTVTGTSKILEEVSRSLNSARQRELDKFISEAYQKNGAVPMAKTVTVDIGNQKPQDYRNNFLAVLGKSISFIGNDAYEKLSSSILSGDFGATITTSPGLNSSSPSTYTLNITNKSGEIAQVEVERSDYKLLTGYEPPVNTNVKNAYNLLNARGTTNLNKPKEFSTAYFKSQDFLNFNSDQFSLMGDLEEDVANPNIVYPRIYIFDKTNNSFLKSFMIGDIPIPKKLSDGQINPQLESFSNGVTPQFIKQFTNFPIY